jgi:hypothetical protein
MIARDQSGAVELQAILGTVSVSTEPHCCIFQRADFGGKVIRNANTPFGTHSQKSEIFDNGGHFTHLKCTAGEKYEFYASEMSPGLPCTLRN